MDSPDDTFDTLITQPPALLPQTMDRQTKQPAAPPTKRPMGRPSKLTPEIVERLCDALRAGNTREAAAAYAGIARSTFYDWLRRGANPRRTIRGKIFKADEAFSDFSDTVTRAENAAEIRCVAVLQKAAHGWPVKKTTTKTQ